MNTNPIRVHWFFLIAPLILAADIYLGVSSRGAIDRLVEGGLLFDLAVVVPCLYWLCYRSNGRKAILRSAAFACLGVWIALKLVPEPEREILQYVEPLRYIGLAVLIWFEIAVVIAVYRTVFKGGSVTDAARQAETELPPWVAKLLAAEARLWLRAWQFIKRLVGRNADDDASRSS